MDKIKILTEKHSFINDTIFKLKTYLLTGNRMLKNILYPVMKFDFNSKLIHNPIISKSESELWNPFDNNENWILTAGKIENLRIAAKKINGIEVKANEIFSFWKHIGNPNFGKRYVIGREIREGCIVPTIAGGLCQLSNALYDAALNANFEIVERHKHTKVIKGSLAEQNRDATVKWNYLDLRFKSSFDFRIEVVLTSDKLIVYFKSIQKNKIVSDNIIEFKQSNKLNDCYSCGNLACYKHNDRSSLKNDIETTTYILDEKWPEYETYINEHAKPSDNYIFSVKKNRLVNSNRYTWFKNKPINARTTQFQGLFRFFYSRYAQKIKKNSFETSLVLDKKIAFAAAKKINIDSTHLVISQNLLPFIYETGVLGGRTFDVLMTRLPFEFLHENLNNAFNNYPESKTLNDFRAPKKLIELENNALNKARYIITPHSEIAKIFNNKVIKLNWHIPNQTKLNFRGNKILFPASALGRKGAYEIKRLAKELNLNISVLGNAIEYENFWEDIKTEKFNGNFEEIGLVIYPTFIENQPRQLLKVISNQIIVITTPSSGIDASEKVKIVNINDYDNLKSVVKEFLEN
ncbi:MAG: hypothetical protein RLZZ175_3246 [Bacteroidota bacterium]|jgi:hypothetical protein